MKMLTLRICVIVIAAASTSCATYGPSTFWGGYDDKEIEPGIWRVTASSNAISGGEPFTRAMVLYRAAEIAEAHGFSYFRVLKSSSEDYGLTFASSTAVYTNSSGGPGYSKLLFRGASGVDDAEGCRAKKIEQCATLSVPEVKRALAARVGLPPPP